MFILVLCRIEKFITISAYFGLIIKMMKNSRKTFYIEKSIIYKNLRKILN